MNSTNAKDYLPLVQALDAGKRVQVLDSSTGVWRDGEDWLFDSPPSCYRVKPEPRRWWVFVGNSGFIGHAYTEDERLDAEKQIEPGGHFVEVVEVLK